MSYSVSITLQNVYEVVQPLVMAVTGLGQSLVIQDAPNRSAMPPASPGFVVMQLTRQKRLRTNVDTTPPGANPTTQSIEQGTELTLQLDCYGASSGDWAQMLSAILRDEQGCNALEPTCDPLYCDDPMWAPLDDSELQYEQHWMLFAKLQYNPITTVGQQYADIVDFTPVSVNQKFPPG
jgi:hypothetical protein